MKLPIEFYKETKWRQFLRVTVTKYQNLVVLKPQHFFSHFWRLEFKVLVCRDVLSDKSKGESLCLSVFAGNLVFYLEDISTAVTWPPFPCVSSHHLPMVSLSTFPLFIMIPVLLN